MIIGIVNNSGIYNASATSLGAIDSLDLLYDIGRFYYFIFVASFCNSHCPFVHLFPIYYFNCIIDQWGTHAFKIFRGSICHITVHSNISQPTSQRQIKRYWLFVWRA